jgi:hypothetical protein
MRPSYPPSLLPLPSSTCRDAYSLNVMDNLWSGKDQKELYSAIQHIPKGFDDSGVYDLFDGFCNRNPYPKANTLSVTTTIPIGTAITHACDLGDLGPLSDRCRPWINFF